MPELPEVETIRRDLARRVVGKKITGVLVSARQTVKNKPADFTRALTGKKFEKIERRGKLLAFAVGDKYLLTHLKMTGQLVYKNHRIIAGGHKLTAPDMRVPNKFTRVTISFADKTKLFFNDMRRFGYMKVVSPEEKARAWREDFGMEPMTADYKLADFAKLLKGRKTNVKALIMNQKLIAGVGNIYADEACFCARVLPWRRVGSLKPAEVKKLFQCIARVLKTAIKNRGTSFSDFVDAGGKSGGHFRFLKVYERDGEKCHMCGSVIKKTRHAGRGTHYCPKCQR